MLARLVPLLLLAAAISHAQPIHFETASVIPDKSQLPSHYDGGPGQGAFTFTRVPLSYLIAQAYDLEPYQVSGPAWLKTETYNVTTTNPPGIPDTQWGQLMVNLLAERFGLKTHREMKELPGYELTFAPDAPTPTPLTETDEPELPRRMNRYLDGVWHFDFTSMQTMRSMLSLVLAQPTTRPPNKIPIADKTGLKGNFDFHLEFLLPESEDLLQGLTRELRQQLGLILKPANVAVEILVIDHADRVPLAN
jgi:uncharacterized protein (TIGR03435 family)